MASQSAYPEHTLSRAAGRCRARTLRQRVRLAYRLCEWQRSVTGTCWPTKWTQVADFIADQVAVSGHKTFPKSVLTMVQFIEERGSVDPRDQMG
eukprot:11055807-Karenia_brevis.AAC.1